MFNGPPPCLRKFNGPFTVAAMGGAANCRLERNSFQRLLAKLFIFSALQHLSVKFSFTYTFVLTPFCTFHRHVFSIS